MLNPELLTAMREKVAGVQVRRSGSSTRRRHEYYIRNRAQIQSRNRQYRQKNKARIQRQQLIYRRQVQAGTRRQRRRLKSGQGYLFGGFK